MLIYIYISEDQHDARGDEIKMENNSIMKSIF